MGVSRFSVENFLSHSAKKIRGGTLQCFKLRVSKNFMHKKGISLFSVEVFSSHSAEKFRRGTLLCFKKVLVSKILMQRRGGHHGFFSKFFCLTGPKNFLRGPFSVSEIFWYGNKIYGYKMGGVSRFFVGNFLSHSAKNFVGEPFNVSENFGYRKISCRRRGYHYSQLNFYCLTLPKEFVAESWNPSEFEKNSGIENFHA